MKIRTFALTLVCAVLGLPFDAQTFENDREFNPEIRGGNPRTGYSEDGAVKYQVSGVSAAAQQTDGKIIIAGAFTTVGGEPRMNIARLNEDGSLDRSFDGGLGPDGDVHVITFQGDGKILIGGDFQKVNGLVSPGVARLKKDGSVDTSFSPGRGAEFPYLVYGALNGKVVSSVLIQADGKLIVTGSFQKFDGKVRRGIVRLNPNGSIDSTFRAVVGGFYTFAGKIDGAVLLPDGRILIAGPFTTVNGYRRASIARLKPDGGVEPRATFRPPAGIEGGAVAVQADEKILTGGPSRPDTFGRSVDNLARLNPNGALEQNSDIVASALLFERVDTIMVRADGRIIVGGSLFSDPAKRTRKLANLNANGAAESKLRLDVEADRRIQTDPQLGAVAMQADGKILVGA